MMKKIFLTILPAVLFGVFVSMLGAGVIEHTSGDEFCGSCHSMEGVAAAYHDDVHGGNNKNGFKAKCADCHLPHDDIFKYVATKGYTGVKDVLGELFWADTVDWEGRLALREEFTYTSGCVKCHNLDAMKYEIPKAFLAHKDFKTGKVTSCVKCHEHVGHKNIKAHL